MKRFDDFLPRKPTLYSPFNFACNFQRNRTIVKYRQNYNLNANEAQRSGTAAVFMFSTNLFMKAMQDFLLQDQSRQYNS